MPWTESLIDSRMLLLKFVKAGKSKTKVPEDLMPDKAHNFFLKKKFKYVPVFVCTYIHVRASALKVQKDVGSLGARGTGDCEPPMWTLGRELRSCARGAAASQSLTHRSSSRSLRH